METGALGVSGPVQVATLPASSTGGGNVTTLLPPAGVWHAMEMTFKSSALVDKRFLFSENCSCLAPYEKKVVKTFQSASNTTKPTGVV